MAKEETALERIKKFQDVITTARSQTLEFERKINALAAGTQANIEGMVVRLHEDEQVSVTRNDPPEAFTFSERQFLGLMGWGRKHVGEGP